MNWIKRIRWILGPFWYRIFDDQDFLLGVEFLHGLFYKLGGYTFDNWFHGMFPMVPSVSPSDMPFVILLDSSTLHREWYSWMDFVNGDASGTSADLSYLATDADGKGWVVNIVNPVPEPDYMMNHLYKWTLTLKNGPDFKFSNNQILFYTNPADLHLPSVKVTDKDGNLKIYWKLICVSYKDTNDYTAVSGFMSPELNSCADVVWDIHQNGATYYNAKKLLGDVTNCVICEKAGAINDIWVEQDYVFARIDDKIYGSRKPCNFQAGTDVQKGDILFGEMKFYKGSDTPDSSEIPGIRVRTDAGELVADNTLKDVITSGDYKILPMTGDAATLAKYEQICLENSANEKCPFIEIQDDNGKINPYDFVMRVLRRGRTCAVRLTTTSVEKLEAAIDVLRKSTNLGGLLTVYVGTEASSDIITQLGYTVIDEATSTAQNATETLPLEDVLTMEEYPIVTVSGFTADSGMGVVAVDAAVTVQGQLAEARILP